jgi:lipoyl(octanoyl) transferase
MALSRRQPEAADITIDYRLLGQVPFPDFLALQERLVYEAGGHQESHIVVLLCEHPDLITIGRAGSRGHIRLSDAQLRRERLGLRWVGRGGGSVLHTPGQLAVYPIAPLQALGWSVGEYLGRLQQGIVAALAELQVHGQTRPDRFGVGGRSGLLAGFGVAVRRWVTAHGVFLNVNPAMRRFAYIDTVPGTNLSAGEKTTMGCLSAERQGAVRMSSVRSAVIAALAAAFGSEQYHLHTGHPWLVRSAGSVCAQAACES